MIVKIIYNRIYGDWEIREKEMDFPDGEPSQTKSYSWNIIWNNHTEDHKKEIQLAREGKKRRRSYTSKERIEVEWDVDDLRDAKTCCIMQAFEDL